MRFFALGAVVSSVKTRCMPAQGGDLGRRTARIAGIARVVVCFAMKAVFRTVENVDKMTFKAIANLNKMKKGFVSAIEK